MTNTSRWSPAETNQLLEELKSSGLSIAKFAKQRGIAAHRLYWVLRKERSTTRKLERPNAKVEFNEVVVTDAHDRQAAPVEIRLRDGLSICVTRDFDEVALRRLLGLLSPC